MPPAICGSISTRSSNEVLTNSAYYTVIISLTETFFQKAVQNGYVAPDNKAIHEIACDLCVIVKGCIFQWCINRGSFSLPEHAKDLLTRCVFPFVNRTIFILRNAFERDPVGLTQTVTQTGNGTGRR